MITGSCRNRDYGKTIAIPVHSNAIMTTGSPSRNSFLMKQEKDGRRLSHEVLEQYRFRAMELREKGWMVKEIAESFGLHPDAVSRWFVNFRRKGKLALKSTKAPGPKPKLSQKQLADLVNCLKSDALNFGFETPLWTCNELRLLILKRYKKKIFEKKRY